MTASRFDFSGSNFALERRSSVIAPFYSLECFILFFSVVEVATSETTMSKAEKWIREDHVAAQP